jgi:hypothetical protein
MTIAISIAAAAALALAIGFAWWLAAWARGAATDARDYMTRGVRLENQIADRDRAIADLKDILRHETAARGAAVEALHRATKRLAALGDTGDLVDALNVELAGLQGLSALRAAAAPEPDRAAGPVHGTDALAADDDPTPPETGRAHRRPDPG